ncbi:MAG: zinc ribbon domain-containing protein [Lachnospiraceae bacterium]|nr:zinc ribbon domain-containing protein [Lachnospiraceae bacterium]
MGIDFGKVKDTILGAGKDVESMAKNASAIAKLKYDIRVKEDFLEKQYALLGKAYYEAHKGEEVEEMDYFEPIAEAEEEIIRLNDELLSAQGAVICPSCGEKQTDKHAFCSSCGTQLKKEEPEVVAEVMNDEDVEVIVSEVVVEESDVEEAETVEEVVEAVEEAIDEEKIAE